MSGINFSDAERKVPMGANWHTINNINDFPNQPSGGEILLESGNYLICGDVDIGTNSLKIADGALVFIDGRDLDASQLIWSGTGSMIIDNPATAAGNELRIGFMRIISNNGGKFVDFPDSGARRGTLWLRGPLFVGFDSLGTVENFDFFSQTLTDIPAVWDVGFELNDIGQFYSVTQYRFSNNNNGTALSFGNGTFGIVVISNCIIEMGATEAFCYFNPTGTFGAVTITSNATTASGEFFRSGLTGDITSFADAGGGQVTVTSASHGLSNGDAVFIDNTMNYNGGFSVSNVTTNTFEITSAFAGDDGMGDFDSGSLNQKRPEFVVRGNSNVKDSIAEGFMSVQGNVTQTVISAINTPVQVNAVWTKGVSERFLLDPNGTWTYTGLEPIDVSLTAIATLNNAGGGTDTLSMYIGKNGSAVSETKSTADINTEGVIAAQGLISLVTNDTLELFVENNSDTSNITVSDSTYKIN